MGWPGLDSEDQSFLQTLFLLLMSCVCGFLTLRVGGAVTNKNHGGMSSNHIRENQQPIRLEDVFAWLVRPTPRFKRDTFPTFLNRVILKNGTRSDRGSQPSARLWSARACCSEVSAIRPALHGAHQLGEVTSAAVLLCGHVPQLTRRVAQPHRHAQRLAFFDGQSDVLAHA